MERSVSTDDCTPPPKPAETLVCEEELLAIVDYDPIVLKHRATISELLGMIEEERKQVHKFKQNLTYHKELLARLMARMSTAELRIARRRNTIHKHLLSRKILQRRRLSPRTLGML